MLVSDPVLPSAMGTPALRQYFWANMSVATCDQKLGTSTLSILNTIPPSGFFITDVRISYLNISSGLIPSRVKCRLNFKPFDPSLGEIDVLLAILNFY